MCTNYIYRIVFPEFVLFYSEDILILKTSMKTLKGTLKKQIYNFEVSSILSFVENFKICNSYIFFKKKWGGIAYVKIRVRTDQYIFILQIEES